MESLADGPSQPRHEQQPRHLSFSIFVRSAPVRYSVVEQTYVLSYEPQTASLFFDRVSRRGYSIRIHNSQGVMGLQYVSVIFERILECDTYLPE